MRRRLFALLSVLILVVGTAGCQSGTNTETPVATGTPEITATVTPTEAVAPMEEPAVPAEAVTPAEEPAVPMEAVTPTEKPVTPTHAVEPTPEPTATPKPTGTPKPVAESSPIKDFKYSYEEGKGGMVITGYVGNDSRVVVPGAIDGKPVVEIGAGAFAGCENLVAIELPEGLTTIGTGAFESCCLEQIAIPETVVSIGATAFGNCYDKNGKQAEGIPGYAYTVLDEESIIFEGWTEYIFRTSFRIPEKIYGRTVVGIGKDAFAVYTGITELEIPDSVIRIPDGALEYYEMTITCGAGSPAEACAKEKGLDFVIRGEQGSGEVNENSAEHIFEYEKTEGGVKITGLKDVSKTEIIIPESIGGQSVVAVGKSAFANRTGIVRVIFPADVECIEDWAFYGCSGLKEVRFPSGLKTVGNSAFTYCSSLQEALFMDGVTSIGDWAFSQCGVLERIALPNSVTYIGTGAFFDSGNPVITCGAGSYAERYAKEEGINYTTR